MDSQLTHFLLIIHLLSLRISLSCNRKYVYVACVQLGHAPFAVRRRATSGAQVRYGVRHHDRQFNIAWNQHDHQNFCSKAKRTESEMGHSKKTSTDDAFHASPEAKKWTLKTPAAYDGQGKRRSRCRDCSSSIGTMTPPVTEIIIGTSNQKRSGLEVRWAAGRGCERWPGSSSIQHSGCNSGLSHEVDSARPTYLPPKRYLRCEFHDTENPVEIQPPRLFKPQGPSP